MRRLKKSSFAVIMILFVGPLTAFATRPDWENICPDPQVSYCNAVGKNAYNNYGNPPALRGIKVGKIVGFTWMPKGSVIGISPADPARESSKKLRRSFKDAYYFIIDDGSGSLFLRDIGQIEVR